MRIELEPFTEGGTEPLATPAEETEEIELFTGNFENMVQTGLELQAGSRNRLIAFLREYSDIFAWTPTDMPVFDKSITVHKLSANPQAKPIKQK